MKTLTFYLILLTTPAFSLNYWLETEGGAVFQSINDVQIPASSGTRFSLADFSTGPWFAYRAYIGFNLSDHHSMRLLFAPLNLSATGTPASNINFQNQTFAAGTSTTGKYIFNSYRLTYRYQFETSRPWEFYLGFTGKVRDASISLSQGNLSAERSNVGFVPLLHLNAKYFLNYSWWLDLDIDALASPNGRAEDAALKLYFKPDPELSFAAGYRTIEGGSDGSSVYGFAWLHYGILSVKYEY